MNIKLLYLKKKKRQVSHSCLAPSGTSHGAYCPELLDCPFLSREVEI